MADLFFHLLPQTNISDWASWATQAQWETYGHPGWVKVADADMIRWCRMYGTDYSGTAPRPVTRVYYRPCFLPADNGEGDCGDGALWGHRVVDQITSNGHIWPDAIGYRNELNPTAENAAQYQRYRSTLRLAGYTGLVVYGSFGNGRPDWPEYATIPADADALELHEYFGRTVAGSHYLALRHLDAISRGLLPATLPLFIGECGADRCGDGTDGRGWRDKLTPEQMAAQLAIYRTGCAPSVVAAFVFSDGDNGDPQWASFKTRGTAVESAIRATWPKTPPQSAQDAPGSPIAPKGAPAPMMKFLDLSRVNVVTDWAALAANYDGVIIQATYGGNLKTGVQDTWQPYWQAAKAHGLKRMAYHYLYPQYNTPEQEAANFLAHVALDSGDGWAVDVEEPCANPAAYSSAFMQLVEQGLASPRNWYSYPAYIQQYGITAQSVGNPHLWLASYRDTEPAPPAGWASIAIWQHTSNAIVPGIDGVVDEDYLYLTEAQYAALCKPQPQGDAVDPITQLALNRAKAANPAIAPNVGSTNFRAYREQIRVWDANGRPNYLDPGPWLRNEAATATDAYVPLDSGIILHSTNKSGQWVTFLAEDKERAAIYAGCGWGKAA